MWKVTGNEKKNIIKNKNFEFVCLTVSGVLNQIKNRIPYESRIKFSTLSYLYKQFYTF